MVGECIRIYKQIGVDIALYIFEQRRNMIFDQWILDKTLSLSLSPLQRDKQREIWENQQSMRNREKEFPTQFDPQRLRNGFTIGDCGLYTAVISANYKMHLFRLFLSFVCVQHSIVFKIVAQHHSTDINM